MSTYQTEEKENTQNNRKILLIVVGVLVLANIITLFLFYQNNQENETVLQSNKQELQETYNKLESISNELDLKIEEIQKLGGDVEELRLIRETLEQEKEQLQNNDKIAQKRYAQIRNRVEGYSELLVRKDAEIAELKKTNEALYSENTELKEEKIKLNRTLTAAESDKKSLAQKVKQAGRLKAENMKIVGLNDNGKAKERDRYRNSQIETVQLSFNLAKNEVAPIEGKDIYVRVLAPDGSVIFDVAKGSGTFMHEGKEMFYTLKKEILYDNTGQQISFMYEKGSDYTEGRHTVEIYADDYIIGKTNFEVR